MQQYSRPVWQTRLARNTGGLLQSQVQEQFNVVSTCSNAQRGHQMAACSQGRAGAHIETEAGAKAATYGMLCIQTAERVKPALGRLNIRRGSVGRPAATQTQNSTSHVQVLPITMATAAANRRSKHNQRMVAMGALTTLTTEGKPTKNRHAVDNSGVGGEGQLCDRGGRGRSTCK